MVHGVGALAWWYGAGTVFPAAPCPRPLIPPRCDVCTAQSQLPPGAPVGGTTRASHGRLPPSVTRGAVPGAGLWHQLWGRWGAGGRCQSPGPVPLRHPCGFRAGVAPGVPSTPRARAWARVWAEPKPRWRPWRPGPVSSRRGARHASPHARDAVRRAWALATWLPPSPGPGASDPVDGTQRWLLLWQRQWQRCHLGGLVPHWCRSWWAPQCVLSPRVRHSGVSVACGPGHCPGTCHRRGLWAWQ